MKTVSTKGALRAKGFIGCSVIAMSIAMAPGAAWAQDMAEEAPQDAQCVLDVDGNLTCTSDGVIVAEGIITPGVELIDGRLKVNGSPGGFAGEITATDVWRIYGDNTPGVGIYVDEGDIQLTFNGDIETFGGTDYSDDFYADGITLWNRGEGNVSLDADNLTTYADESYGLYVLSGGNADLVVGNVTTYGERAGAIGIGAVGDVSLQCGNVTTSGEFATAVFVGNNGSDDVGNVTIACGDIVTSGLGGDGLQVTGATSIDVTLGDVTMTGSSSHAVDLRATGDVTLVVGDVVSGGGEADESGDYNYGIDVMSGTGTMNVTYSSITLNESFANGPALRARGMDTVVNGGDISSSATARHMSPVVSLYGRNSLSGTIGNITTSGQEGVGVSAQILGTADLATGDIATNGRYARGLVVNAIRNGGDATFRTGNIFTIGDDAQGIYYWGTGADVAFETGDISTEGMDSHGFHIYNYGSFQAFSASLTSGDIGTLGARSSGVHTQGLVDNLTLDISTISTAGEKSHGLKLDVSSALVAEVGDVATAGYNSHGMTLASGGTADVVMGDISTTGDYSSGVYFQALAGAGDTSIRTGDISTAGAQSHGVQAYESDGLIDIVTGSISTSGADGSGITMFTRGDVSVVTGDVTSTGFSSDGVSIYTQGDVSVVTGNVLVTGEEAGGLGVFTEGSASVQCGDVSAKGAGSAALYVQAEAGVSLACGDVTLTDGVLPAVVLASAGDIDASLGNVSAGTTDAIDVETNGKITLSVGSVSGENAIDLIGFGGTTLTINGEVVGNTGWSLRIGGGAADVTIADGGALAGSMQLTGNDDTFAIAQGGSWMVDATSDFGDGIDAVENAGTVTLGDDSAFTGLESFSNLAGGVLNLGVGDYFAGVDFSNAGTINTVDGSILPEFGDYRNEEGATLNFGAGTTTIARDEELVTVLAVPDTGVTTTMGAAITKAAHGGTTLTNAGTMTTVDGTIITGPTHFVNESTGSLLLGEGTTQFLGLATFLNEGTVEAFGTTVLETGTTFENRGLVDLSDGNTGDMLTIGTDYAGGGNATVRLDYNGGASDVLAIQGDASGVTTIVVQNGAPLAFNSAGTVLVTADSADDGAFVLASSGTSNLLGQQLVQDSGTFSLVTLPTAAAFEPAALPSLSAESWRRGALVTLDAAQASGGWRDQPILGGWIKAYGGTSEHGGETSNAGFGGTFASSDATKMDHYGLQAGADYAPGGVLLGLTGGWQRVDARFGAADAGWEGDVFNLGAYARIGDPQAISAVLLVKHDWLDGDLSGTAFGQSGGFGANAFGVEGLVSYRLPLDGTNMRLDAGFAAVATSSDGFVAETIAYEFDEGTSVRGRLGARVDFSGSVAPYIGASLNHDFGDAGSYSLAGGGESASFGLSNRGTWGRVEAGFDGGEKARAFTFSAYAEIGDIEAYGASLGWRF